MKKNILKNIVFIPALTTILVSSNLRGVEIEDSTFMLEKNLTELEGMQNDEANTQQNNSLDFNEKMLLKDDDKKEIRFIKTQKIGENADLIFNIIEEAKNNFNKITKDNKKIETQDQYGMKNAFSKIKIEGQELSNEQNKRLRELLYSSLDWDENLLEKFKTKLINTIEIAKSVRRHIEVPIVAINIQINSQIALQTVCCDFKAKDNLYNKLTTEQLQSIKNKVNNIMTLRKEWQSLINNDNFAFLNNDLYKNMVKISDKIKYIKIEIQTILIDNQ
ncbi:CRASP family complement regulator-acquiring lipoprotein [Borrelia miyamotoi]|uniref:CRASP family complement regulator-acquiring lipoprotein n=1 Tax=Borrelia miyamotoi TaxID=47466 RepID=A0AAQ2WXR2_9SPIR|nr:CRASP family complement regulator-acquiring lipoprotein [Borrelia miyamotoi]QTL83977.1 hypothetical protein bmLB2001_001235 [Borrelia miyamotoi]WAZ85612.1 CRASP family complement regulator-acquiring lipoprotein [Borrelia miyamotoi]WAZ91396.1 CRASP family complement regulator-acquiring lipoprotein [Borrelia miyamotoi]WAZ92682.1 CRASP family complement regulator-acquiring lipoprotein [Borrelia miyamotoi]WAZ93973.1 CRASP family complement regulator-acquiring lipoprotein [Borrelia miyamotoi]